MDANKLPDPIIQSCVGYKAAMDIMLEVAKVNDRDITFDGEMVFKKGTLLLHHASARPIPVRWLQISQWFKPTRYEVVSKLVYRSGGWNKDTPIYHEIDIEKLCNL